MATYVLAYCIARSVPYLGAILNYTSLHCVLINILTNLRYTQESKFYKGLNKSLGKRDRSKLLPYFPYLKILLTALHKLPPCPDVIVNRGVKLPPLGDGRGQPPLADRYAVGDEPIWWAFSSATASLSVLQSEQFLGTSGNRTIFQLKVRRAVDVSKYSAIKAEDERLILCGTPFKVTSKLNAGNGLWMVQMEEDVEAPALVTGFAFATLKGTGGGGRVGGG